MEIFVATERAPGGIVSFRTPSGEVMLPPLASMVLITGLPIGVPIFVTNGVVSPLLLLLLLLLLLPLFVGAKDPLLQQRITKRRENSSMEGRTFFMVNYFFDKN